MKDNKSILALDLARRTGWAYGKAGETPRHGSITLGPEGSSIDDLGASLIRWMIDFNTINTIDIVYVEAPISASHMAGKTSGVTILNLNGLYSIAVAIAKMQGHPRNRSNVQDVRKFFVGTSRPADKKQAVIARCRQFGWRPADDNAADALALWAFACAKEAPDAPLKEQAFSDAEAPLGEDEIPEIEF